MTEKPFRPLLACETPEDLDLLHKYKHLPLLCSYKIDGIRAIQRFGQLMSRTMKRIPNSYVHGFCHPLLEGIDGELLAQTQVGPTIYHDTYSDVMTHGSNVPVNYYVFDLVDADPIYSNRLQFLRDRIYEVWGESRPEIVVLEQRLCHTIGEILEMEQEALDLGYEGLVMRRPDSPYKQGRSTLREGHLIKLARVSTAEAVVCGFEEMMHNDNPAETSALGFTERSSHKANLRPSGMLGALIVTMKGVDGPFKIGTGFDHILRKEIWEKQDQVLGQYVKFKYKPYGTKDAPRQPSFIGWRSPDDM